MRSLIALALITTPAFAHPGHGVHPHEAHGVWIAAAFGLATALTLAVMLRPARAKA
jgi:predicted outer membrane lipoprotein